MRQQVPVRAAESVIIMTTGGLGTQPAVETGATGIVGSP
jgi:hypothetical protein